MDLAEARRVLGVTPTQDWSEIRASYRARIRRAHPDVAGEGGTEEALELNAAYRLLSIARREGRLFEALTQGPPATPRVPRAEGEPPRAARPEWSEPMGPPPDARLLEHDTIVLSSTPPESFRRLVEAVHEIGDVSYIDRSSGIFEAVVTLDDGKAASLVVSLQWRAHDATCEAFCTLEALDRAEHLDVSGVLRQLMVFLPADREEPSA